MCLSLSKKNLKSLHWVDSNSHSHSDSQLSAREGGGRWVFASIHLFLLLSNAHLEFQVHTVYLSAGTSALGGLGSACFSISYSFQSRNPVQIYNTGRNLSCPLAKWLHQRASLVETEQVCQNNTAWKTPRTPEEEKKWQWRWGLFFFLLGCEFPPVKLLQWEGPKTELIALQNGAEEERDTR